MADKKQKKQNIEGGELRTLASDLKRLEGKQAGGGKQSDSESDSQKEGGSLKGNIIEDEEEQQKQTSQEAKQKTQEEEEDPLASLKQQKSQKQKEEKQKESDLSLLDEEELEDSEIGKESEEDDDNPLKDLEKQKDKERAKPSSDMQRGIQMEEEDDDPFYKSIWFIVTVVIIVLLAIGGGVYFYLSSNNSEESVPPSSSEQQQEEEPSENTAEEEENQSSSSISPSEIIASGDTVQVSLEDEFRQSTLDVLSDKSETWIEVIPVSSQERASLEKVASQMSISFPSQVQNNLETYQLLVYNQDGVYKLGMILDLSSQNAPNLVESWSSDIPFDMSNFALETSSRTVVEPQVKTRSLSLEGASLRNYYYNYTDTFNSIDVAGQSDKVFMSTSKQMQQELANQLGQ